MLKREFGDICTRLGTVAERLVGVWRDYSPRLKALEGNSNGAGEGVMGVLGARGRMDKREVERQMGVQRELQLMMMRGMIPCQQQQQQQQVVAPPRYESVPVQSQIVDEKQTLRQTENSR